MKRIIFAACAAIISTFSADAVDWKASWIGAPWEGEEYLNHVIQPAPLLRKDLSLDKKVRKATAFVTGLGFFEFYVNGQKVSDEVLCPNETSYGHRPGIKNYFISMDDTNWNDFRVFYMTYDVTRMLRKGDNTLAAVLGNGFFSTGRTRWVEPYGTPRFICQVEIEYKDGTSETVVSDRSWMACRGPILNNDLYEGEIYDARKAVDSWNDVPGNTEGWEPAALRKAPDGGLRPQNGPSDRIMEVIEPQSIKKLDDGSWEVDFGDYVSGWVRLKDFTAPEGSEIEVFFPIETAGNGVYKYISDGKKVDEYAPRFTWWLFTKAIVKGWPGELTRDNIQAEVVHSDVEVTGHFACSNEMFNRINAIWQRTQTDNMHLGVATDCPHREKGPYTGDGEVSCVAVMHNFGVYDFYHKWMRDMADCQDKVTGYVPNGAPWHPGCGGGVAWGAAMCVIPWEFYMCYGDKDVLAEFYKPMTEEVRFLSGWRLEDGTVYQQLPSREDPCYWLNLGEWCPPYGLPSENLVHTWYLWRVASYTASAAAALGYEEDAARYKALAEDVAACFHKRFYDEDAGTYRDSSGILSESGYGTGKGVVGENGDGSNIFALAMGVPADRYEKVIAKVKAELEASDGHLNTGIYGTPLFFEVLCNNGMAEAAFEAMNKKDYPGYGWWLENGALTTWEQWNGENSRCHPMFGGGLVWLYRNLAGLKAAEPGYRHILFQPTPVGDITWASYDTMTPQGKAAIKWNLKGDRIVVRMLVPKGSTATLRMPDGTSKEYRQGRHRFRGKLS